MTAPEHFDLRAIAPQPWKNGAGLTREIAFGGASRAHFDWRISIAEVECDAPFSAFPGVDRCIVLLRGAGMRLRSTAGEIDHALTTPLAPFRFAGDVALTATLVDGPSSDFNVMTRRGVWRSDACVLRGDGEIQRADLTMLLCVEGEWQIEEVMLAPMQGLLLPFPLGEGLRRSTEPRFARPLPNPSPGGEGVNAALLVVHLHREKSP